jgi:adenine deaminase
VIVDSLYRHPKETLLKIERMTATTPIEDWIRKLPKAELHMHLEGSLEPDMLFALAERNRIPLRWTSVDDLRAGYEFENLTYFLSLYFEGCRVLVREQDFYDVTAAYLAKAHEHQVRRAEVFLGPQSFTERGVPLAAIMEGVLTAMNDAHKATGISAGFIVSVHRHRPVEDALQILDNLSPWSQHIAGIGMGGPEVGYPPGRFQPFFEKAKRLGYKTTVHAGEEGPPAYIAEALDKLQVERIDHGIAAIQSVQVTQTLVERQIPLTVCPLSNIRLKAIAKMENHPLRSMLERGLRVSIHSDDPPYFGGYVNENYIACWRALDLSIEQLVQLARNSFSAAFTTREEIDDGLRAIDAHLASGLPPGAP